MCVEFQGYTTQDLPRTRRPDLPTLRSSARLRSATGATVRSPRLRPSGGLRGATGATVRPTRLRPSRGLRGATGATVRPKHLPNLLRPAPDPRA
jgi:hypothetical protein